MPKTEYDAKGKPSEAWLRRVYLEELHSVAEIAEEAGRHERHIYWLFKRYGIPLRTKTVPIDGITLERLYLAEDLSLREIAERYGISDSTVWWWLMRYHIPVKQPKPRKAPVTREDVEHLHFEKKRTWDSIRKELGYSRVGFHYLLDRLGVQRQKRVRVKATITRDDLYQWHVVEGETAVKIAARLGCNASTVQRLVRRYGLDPGHPLINERREPPITRDEVERLYVAERLSYQTIGEQYGVSFATVKRWLAHYGIAPRTGKRLVGAPHRTYTRRGTLATRGGHEFSAEERFLVLTRDGFRCQMPGCSAPNRRHALEVHHIVPIEQGGTHDLANGIALCRRCHIGIKGREGEYVNLFQALVGMNAS